jgi:hypothetical protein
MATPVDGKNKGVEDDICSTFLFQRYANFCTAFSWNGRVFLAAAKINSKFAWSV